MEIVIAIALLGGLGLIFGLVLAAASKVFYVETDPRLEQLNACLPGANCGGCGYAGCGGYAEAVLNGEAPIGKCNSGGNECAQAMAAIMGVEAGEVTRKVALVRCSGEKTMDADGNLTGAKIKANYEGFHDCVAASKVGGNGPLSCKYGCLGFGTCTKACKYDAIHIVNGVAKVNEDRCVGCLACAAVCPRQLIVPVEPKRNVVIACNSMAKGAVTTRGCTVGCIGFGTCVKACKYDAIHVVNGVAKVNTDVCVGCMACAAACPRNLIVPVDYGTSVIVACNSHAKGAVTVRGCTQGCIGCGLCTKICPHEAIKVENNLAVIDYTKCTSCGLCAAVCPKKLIACPIDTPDEILQIVKTAMKK